MPSKYYATRLNAHFPALRMHICASTINARYDIVPLTERENKSGSNFEYEKTQTCIFAKTMHQTFVVGMEKQKMDAVFFSGSLHL